MCKNIMVYENWGVLAHEKQPVYTLHSPASDAHDRVILTVDVPTWTSKTDEPGVTLDGSDYLLNEVLRNWGDAPALIWYDGNSTRRIMLKSRMATRDEYIDYQAGEWIAE